MKTLTFRLFLFFLFFSANPVWGSEIKFPLDIQDGTYVLQEGSSSDCLEGDLEVKKIDKDYSILIGARLLVSDVREGRISKFSNDGECDFKIFGNSKAGHLKATWIEKCKGKEARWDELDFSYGKGEIEYKKIWKETLYVNTKLFDLLKK